MNEENEAALDEIARSMNIREPYYGIGDGWFHIMRDLMLVIRHHVCKWTNNKKEMDKLVAEGKEVWPWLIEYFQKNPENPWADFGFAQIKEKFGGLRVYTDLEDDYIRAAILMAEFAAARTCEICGAPGKIENIKGWYTSCCKTHKKEIESK